MAIKTLSISVSLTGCLLFYRELTEGNGIALADAAINLFHTILRSEKHS